MFFASALQAAATPSSGVLGTAAVFLNSFTSLWQVGLPAQSEASRVVLVHCHPCEDSFSRALATAVLAGLTRGGHEVRCISLYGNSLGGRGPKGWAPLLTKEHHYYHELALPKKGWRVPSLEPEVASAVKDLQWANAVVFVYPTWWFNVPGAMKNFLDRTLLPWVAFKHGEDKDGNPKPSELVPLLTNIEKVGVVTTYGAPLYAALLVGDAGREMFSRSIRGCFNSQCPMLWMGLGEVEERPLQDRVSFLVSVEERFSNF